MMALVLNYNTKTNLLNFVKQFALLRTRRIFTK